MFTRIVTIYIIMLILLIDVTKASVPEYVPGELLVRFAPKLDGKQKSIAEKDRFLASINGGAIKHSYKLVAGLSLVKLPESRSVINALAGIKNNKEISYAQPNYILHAKSTFPNDMLLNDQWALNNIGQFDGTHDADIDAPEAWDIIHDACDTTIAVIDSGIDYTHIDLIANRWLNSGEIPGNAINDDGNYDSDGNPLIDDVYGYDFCTCTDEYCTNSSKQRDSDPMDDNGHGTHVAGIIGSVGNNGKGVAGVCWNTKIMALKFLNYAGYGKTSDAISAIEYAVDKGAKVLNNSWGGSEYSQALKDAIDDADASGVIFISSAGNEGHNNDWYPQYPSSYNCDNIISVMATDQLDQRSIWSWDSSNYGLTTVDLAAPGSDILSCVPGNSYESWGGTSMATPHVAGACALVWAANPELTHLEVKDYVLRSVDKLDSLEGLCVTEGRLNLYRAIKGKAVFPSLVLTKEVEDANCVSPFIIDNYLDYKICYDANGAADTNVVIIDYLPDEVEYYSSNPLGIYDSNSHTVTLDIGDVEASDSNCVTVSVKVTTDAVPGGALTSNCEIEGDSYIAEAFNSVCVSCWAGEILYVDADANEGGNGLTWTTAYNNLQDALETARNYDCYNAIWVAGGTYKPIWDSNGMSGNEAFELVDDVALFGHFGGIGIYENSVDDRDFSDANNITILDGQIGALQSESVNNVIKAEDIASGIVDGFTIQNSSNSGAGVYLNNSDVSIVNCKMKDNQKDGIYADNGSSSDIHNCVFMDNDNSDIKILYGSSFEISNCIFDGNDTTDYGIYSIYTTIDIEDSEFHDYYSYGIYKEGCGLTAVNSTIDNSPCGFYLADGNAVINNCFVQNSSNYGINSYACDTSVNKTVLANNGCGLYMFSDWLDSELILNQSVIRQNYDGITLVGNFYSSIINSWIHDNGIYGGAGIYLGETTYSALIQNNTIYNNYNGIDNYGSEDPNICNCIIYGNDTDLSGSFGTVNYCNLTNVYGSGTGNISSDPCFINVAIDSNDLHIDANSQCKDAGNPYLNYGGQTDIDGEDRVYYGSVDIGADEYYWSSADFNVDGIVNYIDYSIFAEAWWTDSSDGSYNDICDLADNNMIDCNDLAVLSEEWLWKKAWEDGWMMCMGGGTSGLEMMMMDSGLETLEMSSAVPELEIYRDASDDLMLSADESFRTRPERLATKSQKFYDIKATRTVYPYDYDLTIKQVLEFLDEMWLNGELSKTLTEKEYLEFRDALIAENNKN